MSSQGNQETDTAAPNNASETSDDNVVDTRRSQRDQDVRRQPTYNRSSTKFKGKIEDIKSLTTKDESRKNNFTKFKSDVLQYVLKHFSHAVDIVPALKASNDPIAVFNKTAPSKTSIKSRLGLSIIAPPLSITTYQLLILDTGSTFNSSCNPDLVETDLVENIRACEDGEGIRAYSNSGSTDYNHEADVTLLPAMQTYYNSSGIANVLSFFEVQKFYHVKFDSKVKNEFYVRTYVDTLLRFKCLSRGLYYVDMDNLNDHICSESHVLLFSTVKANKEFFSNAEIKGAENARILQQRLHYPSDAALQEALDKNFITDTKVTGADVERAEAIMGKAASICKGKTVRKRINSKYKIQRFHIPSRLVKHHPTEELDTDFMYVQGGPYLVTKGQGTKFRAIQSFNRISKRDKNGKIQYKRGPTAVINGIKKVKEKIEERGFKVTVVNGDNEFEKLRGKIGTAVNICGADQHVGERGKLNCELRKLSFGTYCEVKVPATNNAQVLRTVGAIALRPSNEQGGYFFMSLETGATAVPDDDTIVEDSSTNNDIYSDDDSSYVPNDDDSSNDNSNHNDSSSDEIDDADDDSSDNDNDNDNDNSNSHDIPSDAEAIGATTTTDSSDNTSSRPRRNTRAPERLKVSHSSQKEKTYDATVNEPHPHGELQFTEIDVNQILSENDKELLFDSALHVLFNQMSAKQGIKEFGEEAVAAMLKEYKQIESWTI
ncbi:hypothetical protein CTEN210_18685 [Chaetoceros tenuissimus]|uniref:Uncharacterized protein n=1 Tax=Chaetoceros tenuissimus TaxID=426638 RepID=A0AAD3HGC3_9STRA|nr:hypothetical protein CTEN210_18685 [Chaetoceros tenuissimus]